MAHSVDTATFEKALIDNNENLTATARSLGITRSAARILHTRLYQEQTGIKTERPLKSTSIVSVAPVTNAATEKYDLDERPGICRIDSISSRITTAAQAIEQSGLDMNLWQISSKKLSFWEQGVKNKDTGEINYSTLHAIRLSLTRRPAGYEMAAIDNLIKNFPKEKPLKAVKLPKAVKQDPHMLEVGLYDIHIGKLAWGYETGGEDYDLRIAESGFSTAVSDIFTRAAHYPIEQIIFPIGNDYLHIDKMQDGIGTTARGTPQDCDGRLVKIFETGFRAMKHAIHRARQLAPVKLILVAGNHDQTSAYYLIRVLQEAFRDVKGVTFDVTPSPRKYELFGVTLIGLTHGDGPKQSLLPGILAGEAASMWAQSKFREFHCGHLHRKSSTVYKPVETVDGVTIRHLPSLSGNDYWHAYKGFCLNDRAAESYIYSKSRGHVATINTFI